MKKILFPVLLTGALLVAGGILLTGCGKEGPAGANGADGADGVDANETCKLCHAADVVDAIAVQFELSKHYRGEAAYEETGNTTCAPCHERAGFLYVCENNIPATFTWNGTKWNNDYVTTAGSAYGELGCATCHSSLHTTYGYSDISTFTSVAPVAMTMWGGAKTIDLPQDGGTGNLCAKCHQPRPATCNTDSRSRLMPWDTIKDFPAMIFWDSTTGATNYFSKPTYRLHVHYGTVGAVYAGKGGIEYTGSLSYTSSPHTTLASCSDCHMADITGGSGGHTFYVAGNFLGCNTVNCHSVSPISATSSKWVDTRADMMALLNTLAEKINACGGGVDILHINTDEESNLWVGLTDNDYDGYLDIYSSSSNPDGYWRDPANTSSTNMAKPKFPSLTNLQYGALINFQFGLREGSLGIHNTQYIKALLTNTIEQMTAAGW